MWVSQIERLKPSTRKLHNTAGEETFKITVFSLGLVAAVKHPRALAAYVVVSLLPSSLSTCAGVVGGVILLHIILRSIRF